VGASQVRFYDVTGRLVREAVAQPGAAYLDWKGDDAQGRLLPSGIYFVVVKTPAGEQTAKVVLVR
jgi:hypothetical protein